VGGKRLAHPDQRRSYRVGPRLRSTACRSGQRPLEIEQRPVEVPSPDSRGLERITLAVIHRLLLAIIIARRRVGRGPSIVFRQRVVDDVQGRVGQALVRDT
jgi:hypothetical protein